MVGGGGNTDCLDCLDYTDFLIWDMVWKVFIKMYTVGERRGNAVDTEGRGILTADFCFG